MGRNATLRIQNNTGAELNFESSNVVHGKFQSGQEPPGSIPAGTTGVFEVGNRTGSKIGPEGSVTYNFTHLDTAGTLTFYWNHPFSASSSAYSVGSNPEGWVKLSLDPPDPEGHDQDVTYITSLGELPLDGARWMELLREQIGDQPLNELWIPGTHDSGTDTIRSTSPMAPDMPSALRYLYPKIASTVADWAKTQGHSLAGQLAFGARYLDLRVGLIQEDGTDPYLALCHSLTGTKLTDALDQIQEFLASQVQEIVILDFQAFYDMTPELHDVVANELESRFGGMMTDREVGARVTPNTLWEAGTRVIVLYGEDREDGVGKTGSGAKESLAKHQFLWVRSDSIESPWFDTSKAGEWTVSGLLPKLDEFLEQHIPQQPGQLDTFFGVQGLLSASIKLILSSSAKESSLDQVAQVVTPHLADWISNNWTTRGVNIIIADWVESYGTPLFQIVQEHNRALGPRKSE